MAHPILTDTQTKMKKAVDYTLHEFSAIHTGKATPALVEGVMVEAYGSMVPLNQVASLSVPEPAMIIAQPFDPSLMNNVEKGIRAANIGLNPTNDGKVIRIPIPALTDERRRELSKIVHKFAEEGRNGVRLVRREANDKLKKLLKDSKISQDDERRSLDEVQKITDQHVTLIDDIQKKKDTELLVK